MLPAAPALLPDMRKDVFEGRAFTPIPTKPFQNHFTCSCSMALRRQGQLSQIRQLRLTTRITSGGIVPLLIGTPPRVTL